MTTFADKISPNAGDRVSSAVLPPPSEACGLLP